MKIVVIGGSGLIGKKLVARLGERDQEVVAASPSSGVNTVTGEGLSRALADVAITEPLNGMVEIAGPEPIRIDELVRRFLTARGDSRQVITDPQARYYGVPVNDQSLVPGNHPRLGPTRFADWLSRSIPKA